jgi:hypothetical protein
MTLCREAEVDGHGAAADVAAVAAASAFYSFLAKENARPDTAALDAVAAAAEAASLDMRM